MAKNKNIRPAEPDPVELELEVMKYMTIDGLAMSIKSGYVSLEQAERMLEDWFAPDKIAMAALYRQVNNVRQGAEAI